jgi:hypothetical protein
MPKIRGIHPDIWTDEDFVELSPFARLLWVGMWNYACDNGHLRDRSKQIKMRVLPTDDVNCAELLRELESNGRIARVDGWITIPNFSKKQRPDKRYWVTCEAVGCVKPADPERETRGGHMGTRRANVGATSGPLVDGEGDGDGELKVKVTTTSPVADAPAKKPSRATKRPDDFKPTQAHVDLAADLGVDLRGEWAKFCDWCDANGKTYKDWSAALRNWIRNARPGRPAATSAQSRSDGWLAAASSLRDREQTLEIGSAS